MNRVISATQHVCDIPPDAGEVYELYAWKGGIYLFAENGLYHLVEQRLEKVDPVNAEGRP